VELADARWLVDNIVQKVGDGWTTLFWEDLWPVDVPLVTSYARLFDLSENKVATMMEMFELGWGVDGDAWKWMRRLFAWEKGLVGESVWSGCLILFCKKVFQVGECGGSTYLTVIRCNRLILI